MGEMIEIIHNSQDALDKKIVKVKFEIM